MNSLTKLLSNSEKFNSYLQDIKFEKSPVMLTGLTDVSKVIFAYGTSEFTNKKICIITYNEIQARNLVKDFEALTSKVIFFPKKEIVTYDYIAESKDLPYERIDALNKIKQRQVDIIVTTIEALMQRMIPKEVLYKDEINFEVGKLYPLEEVKQKLISLGYVRSDLVEAKGEFSLRGGILDVAISEKKGVRIEFWGDEVDSIRYFSIQNQRSTDMEKKISIYPAHEYVLENTIEDVCKAIRNRDDILNEDILNQDIELIENGNYISKIDKYFDSFYTKTTNLLDYLEDDFLICIDESSKIKAREKNILQDQQNIYETLLEKQKMIPDALKDWNNYDEILKKLKGKQQIYLEKQDLGFVDEETSNVKRNAINMQTREINYFKSSMELFLEEVQRAINEQKTIVAFAGDEEASKKLSLLLLEKEIPHKTFKNFEEELPKSLVVIIPSSISTGFESYDLGLFLISTKDLFDKDLKKRRKAHTAFSEGEKVVFSDLKIGDYVVHRTHGIGKFIGVNTIKADNIIRDYIKIEYRDEDILYIPTNQLDNIRKYIGGGEAEPKLNRLGSKEWGNTKARVKSNLREVAKELIELYAKRQNAIGFAFSKDTPWQNSFEANFPYTETDDQLRCIEEVKKDMEQQKPMDRLLCGDVGYGKTEVAIRAAFKACMDQKQVAYLVPTTVLANQQYETFKERMEEFAIKVELLNRFRTKKEQEEVVKKLKLGEVDVVIGTHRILSKDVQFKDLGLLIIDEEHRFGVKDKEKIKQYKTNVDVLTMTATPIPRTLHMSIVGIRDMSVIYDPPQNRKPVQTYVLEYDEEVVKEAIIKELERNGQVFYLFNNVEQIEKKANEISNLVPEAKIAFAHGKMTGRELEDIMMDFINKKIDVLVCTTILESGIDIPNANTIIVENADRLGLAQLYQIRGRVGRSDIQSYAYITYKPDKLLSEVADKRLKAIKEFTEFGSGFKIAMRDLEIRGAGSLLGEIQSGHMEQVGYDTYCKLLDEVIKEMRGEEVKEEIDVQIDLNISSYIPDEYIENSSQKIEVYQNIALSRTEEDIENVTDEILDRYGQLPKEVYNLLEIARIKELCKKTYITKIASKVQSIIFHFDAEHFNMDIVDNLVKKYRNEIRFSPGKEPYITYKVPENSDSIIIKKVKEFLSTIEKGSNIG